MSKTTDALKAAFAGESQASRKYLSFAKKADAEGLPQIARLFRAASHAETIHAHNHLKALEGIQSTAENLQTAIEGENYEVSNMYPEFIRDAEEEGAKKALRSFNWAMEVEKVHEGLYRKALAMLEPWRKRIITYARCAAIRMRVRWRGNARCAARWGRSSSGSGRETLFQRGAR